MSKRTAIPVVLAVALAFAGAASAQDHRIEIGGHLGYTFSEGVPISPVSIGGQTYDAISPVSGSSYGFNFGVFFTENAEVEFQWDRQDSALEAKGRGNKTEFADMKLDNYHVNFVYNWGDSDAALRPFLFGGLGATSYSFGQVEGRDITGETKFSTNWGGGIKLYPARNIGVKVLARWTPTYIKSEAGGIWCSPYWPWGCYVVEDTQYSNQFQLAGGVTFRF